jgi:hypothetical protein
VVTSTLALCLDSLLVTRVKPSSREEVAGLGLQCETQNSQTIDPQPEHIFLEVDAKGGGGSVLRDLVSR